MTETKNTGEKTLSVPGKTLSLKRSSVEQGMVRQSFSHGRSKAVVVEKVKRPPQQALCRPQRPPRRLSGRSRRPHPPAARCRPPPCRSQKRRPLRVRRAASFYAR
jgi:translation initiation factor IF-2